MPVYTYRCPECGDLYDGYRTVEERNDPYECTCGGMLVRDYSRQNVTSTPFFEGAYVFKDGKKQTLYTKQAVQEHCKRNNLIVGSDDLEQESAKNRKAQENEYASRVAENVMDDFKRLQVKKREGKVKSMLGKPSQNK